MSNPGKSPRPRMTSILHSSHAEPKSSLEHLDEGCWFAVWCKPRQESIAEYNLQRQGFHVYLPRLRTKRRQCGKWVEAIEALFPRYMFIRVNPRRCSVASVRSTRGAVGLVQFGGHPAVVPDAVIETLLQTENSGSAFHGRNRSIFSPGDAVKLAEGPLTGLEGVFAREDGTQRVVVLLELLGKINRITVNCDWVARAA